MAGRTSSSKIYLDVVESLRSMIEADSLLPGDKIPSERELSDRFNVGRSSVREALRALELLGLIETRRGEGTFIRDFQEHKLVELLGTFFLQDKKVQEDLSETKRLIEIDCLRIVAFFATAEDIKRLMAWVKADEFHDDDFFLRIAILNRNRLLERIWRIVNSYARTSEMVQGNVKKEDYLALLTYLLERDEEKAIETYLIRIRNMSKDE
ncbi:MULTISPECIES: FadR/GntR family transcriptional regulator [Peribacillus]|uniref:FadR family transcriptional regulator n=3 Tax=Peribacillus TaxID=2675229 RepID=A0A8B5XT51_9BACI|nr:MULTISPECIES: GntR family transcriptional regulator [Peribacillus]MDP1417242.1 GntR family transcriptional regulator [Peribacillus simplex]MDP1449897.1 GntR family transcriptional regulator [Peribacillus frigoritolerans]MDQ0882782.1 GntR family transcriptional repressor for pyruvate dehydrogenase complex [Peribacillus sp. V2I11]MEC1396345.1 GntR family transcriptional regulator [Peribacillus simplex]MED3907900.1 GntR family transcriptional regulator [Peribacillus simplex]